MPIETWEMKVGRKLEDGQEPEWLYLGESGQEVQVSLRKGLSRKTASTFHES